jgi:hypothetical protein
MRSIILAAVVAGLAAPAPAHDLSFNECIEGSEFIANAARSRDYGITRDEFMLRLHDDIAAIQAFPPYLRWFVQDEEDQRLLVAQTEGVFDDPRPPESHRSVFLEACLAAIDEQASRKAINSAEADSIR